MEVQSDVDFQALMTKVEGILQELNDSKLPLDSMVGHLETGLGIIKTMKNKLDQTKLRVEEIRAQFDQVSP